MEPTARFLDKNTATFEKKKIKPKLRQIFEIFTKNFVENIFWLKVQTMRKL